MFNHHPPETKNCFWTCGARSSRRRLAGPFFPTTSGITHKMWNAEYQQCLSSSSAEFPRRDTAADSYTSSRVTACGVTGPVMERRERSPLTAAHSHRKCYRHSGKPGTAPAAERLSCSLPLPSLRSSKLWMVASTEFKPVKRPCFCPPLRYCDPLLMELSLHSSAAQVASAFKSGLDKAPRARVCKCLRAACFLLFCFFFFCRLSTKLTDWNWFQDNYLATHIQMCKSRHVNPKKLLNTLCIGPSVLFLRNKDALGNRVSKERVINKGAVWAAAVNLIKNTFFHGFLCLIAGHKTVSLEATAYIIQHIINLWSFIFQIWFSVLFPSTFSALFSFAESTPFNNTLDFRLLRRRSS